MEGFVNAMPFMPSEENYWFHDNRDLPWGVFFLLIENLNGKIKYFLTSYGLIIDESMSGWIPKTSQYGDIPNYTFEPRNSILLVTMFQSLS